MRSIMLLSFCLILVMTSPMVAPFLDFSENQASPSNPVPIVQKNDARGLTLNYPTNKKHELQSFLGTKKILWFNSFEERNHALDLLGDDVEYVFNLVPAITVNENVDASQFRTVKKVIPSQVTYYQRQVNDPWQNARSLSKEVAFNTLEKVKDWVSIEPLWKMGYYGQNQSIAIVDSGISNLISFNDMFNLSKSRGEFYVIGSLKQNPAENTTQDPSGHGTHVAGIAVGNGYYYLDNSFKLTKSHGMAPMANFKSIRVLDSNGIGNNLDVLMGIDFATTLNVSVISMSFGSNNYNGSSDLFTEIINKVAKKDILAVVAAGNDGDEGGSTVGMPAALENVLSVGALLDAQTIWDFSANGPSIPYSRLNKPDVLAPGVNIVSVNTETAEPVVRSGTSMATPIVSAGALLLRQAFPNATAIEIKHAILAGANDLGMAVERQGRGVVNFTRAYEILYNKYNNTKNAQLERVTVSPLAIHDGREFDDQGNPVRFESNLYYRASIINETRYFNITVFSDENLTIVPKYRKYFGNIEIGLPTFVKLQQGSNIVPINLTVTSKKVEYVKAEIYFLDGQSLQPMKYANISVFSISRFPRGKILFDISKDADTLGDYFLNDGPTGKFIFLNVLLRDKGFIVDFQNKSLTLNLLKQYNILVIADPDVDYSADENTAIRKFVDELGGGLLVLAHGGSYETEYGPMGPFAIDSLNAIFRLNLNNQQIGIRLNKDSNNDGKPDYGIQYDVVGKTLRFQTVLPEQAPLPTTGPYLDILGDDVVTLGEFNGRPIAAAQEVGKGRVIVYSSVLPFIYPVLRYGMIRNSFNPVFTDDPEIPQDVAIDTFEWLIQNQIIKVPIKVNNIKLQTREEINVELYKNFTISFSTPTFSNGTPIQLPSVLKGYLIHNDEPTFISEINFTLVDGEYSTKLTIYFAGKYSMFIPIYYGDQFTNGYTEIIGVLANYNQQKTHDLFAITILFFLMTSWVIWIKNEGGRELKNLVEGKET